MLEVKNICKSFDGEKVLDQINLTVGKHEILGLLGPSGSGKSTLLRIVAGIIIPDSGSISIGNAEVTNLPTFKRNVGMVFQDNQLFPHMNVEQNIEYGLKIKGCKNKQREHIVTEMLTLVGLDGFQKRKVTELSGGESKRVALARSLAPAPTILLLDEPLTGLDGKLHDQLMIDLAKLLKDTKTTAILVTHDKNEADSIADVIHVLS